MPGVALPRTSIPYRDLGEGVEIPLVTSCYRTWYKLWLDGSLGSVQTRPIYGVHYDWPNVSYVFFFGKSQTLSLLRCLLCKLEETNDPRVSLQDQFWWGFENKKCPGVKHEWADRVTRLSAMYVRLNRKTDIFGFFRVALFSFVGRGEQGLWV